MFMRGLVNEREKLLLQSAIGVKALNNQIKIDDQIRANILQQVIIETMKLKDKKQG